MIHYPLNAIWALFVLLLTATIELGAAVWLDSAYPNRATPLWFIVLFGTILSLGVMIDVALLIA